MLSLYVKSQIMKAKARQLLMGEEGQGMAEYGMILGLVVVGVILLVVTLGGQVQTLFTNVTDSLTNDAGITP